MTPAAGRVFRMDSVKVSRVREYYSWRVPPASETRKWSEASPCLGGAQMRYINSGDVSLVGMETVREES